jgi:hypothetical protein
MNPSQSTLLPSLKGTGNAFVAAIPWTSGIALPMQLCRPKYAMNSSGVNRPSICDKTSCGDACAIMMSAGMRRGVTMIGLSTMMISPVAIARVAKWPFLSSLLEYRG